MTEIIRQAPSLAHHLPAFYMTFKQAAASYVEHGGEARYLERIIDHFGDRPLLSIFTFDVHQMAHALFPNHKNVTKNRQAITPARAVFRHAVDRGWCNLISIRNFKAEPAARKVPADTIWMYEFLKECQRSELPHLSTLILFMAQTGARVSEAINLQWREVSLTNRTALLLKTKTETNSLRHLTDILVARLHKLSVDRSLDDKVFHYTSRYSVNERIWAVCERAGIEYKSSHVCGRHTFFTTAFDMGLDIKTIMEAGGIKTVNLFMNTYVAPRVNHGRMTADRLNGLQYGIE